MMLSAYLLIYFLNGTQVLEPIGPIGADWLECNAFVVKVAAERKDVYKEVLFIQPYCLQVM